MVRDTIKCHKCANILIDANTLDYVNNLTYLGHVIDNKLNEELDMKSKENTYEFSNMLIRKFYFSSAYIFNSSIQHVSLQDGAYGKTVI